MQDLAREGLPHAHLRLSHAHMRIFVGKNSPLLVFQDGSIEKT
ncbi:hypothetical protein MtrunA17_Chr8g0342171 [Medicago truncatula]|uniref:Uncharacterized protein n=1 Tax=Medicago truncatula TaxID=3880 RepID=A0A396GEX6_MEDTR|nr:hypothetical protein MtrunA17_Chr8g0342171 [Medicago truncatula]